MNSVRPQSEYDRLESVILDTLSAAPCRGDDVSSLLASIRDEHRDEYQYNAGRLWFAWHKLWMEGKIMSSTGPGAGDDRLWWTVKSGRSKGPVEADRDAKVLRVLGQSDCTFRGLTSQLSMRSRHVRESLARLMAEDKVESCHSPLIKGTSYRFRLVDRESSYECENNRESACL